MHTTIHCVQMNSLELKKLVKQALPGIDLCDSEVELRKRARDEMTYYLRLVHTRLRGHDADTAAVKDNHERVCQLINTIDSNLAEVR